MKAQLFRLFDSNLGSFLRRSGVGCQFVPLYFGLFGFWESAELISLLKVLSSGETHPSKFSTFGHIRTAYFGINLGYTTVDVVVSHLTVQKWIRLILKNWWFLLFFDGLLFGDIVSFPNFSDSFDTSFDGGQSIGRGFVWFFCFCDFSLRHFE
jgi:hypothetical protein